MKSLGKLGDGKLGRAGLKGRSLQHVCLGECKAGGRKHVTKMKQRRSRREKSDEGVELSCLCGRVSGAQQSRAAGDRQGNIRKGRKKGA